MWDFEMRETRVIGFRKEASKLPFALLSNFFNTVWRIAAMEGVKTFSGMWHKEKTAKWKVTQSTAGKNQEESETTALKRTMVLLYEMSATTVSALAVTQWVAPLIIQDEELNKSLALL